MKTKALVLAAILASAPFGIAEEMHPVTMVSNFHVNFGKDQEFLDMIEKLDAPVFEDLMAKGVVLSWGVSTPVLHEPGNERLGDRS